MNIDVDKLQKEYFKVAQKRAENGAFRLQDALKHAAGECIEAKEAEIAYNKVYLETSEVSFEARKNLTEELADIIYCTMTEASLENIKFSEILHTGFEKNQARAEGRGDKV